MKVICAPRSAFPSQVSKTNALNYILYDQDVPYGFGSAGTSILWPIRKFGLNPAPRAWDFLSIALSVLAADEGCPRNSSPDGWTREIKLTVAVADQAFWNTHAQLLESALRFLTGDIWQVSFLSGGFTASDTGQWIHESDVVCLLSGGVDSLVGAIDLSAAGKKPLLVSQVAKGDKHTQRHFATTIANGLMHLQLNHLVRPVGPSERSQRSRSMIFIAYGILAATSLASYQNGQSVDLFMPENGYISLNVPLTPLRLGSLSTRTTHPVFLAKIQDLLNQADLRVSIKNPYQLKTKGEMLLECSNQSILNQHVFVATSCGRFARNGFQHCGRCVPCLIRRAAIHRWGAQDSTSYRYKDLSIPDPRHRNFDDVRSAGMAIEQVKLSSVQSWAGSSLNSKELGAVAPYLALVERGLAELEIFLRAAGAL